MFNNFFFKSCRLWHNLEKYCRAGQATDDNVAHAHFMLDNAGYKYTHRLCNTHCFSTAIMVARTCLCVRLHVHYLSRLYIRYCLCTYLNNSQHWHSNTCCFQA